MRNPLAVDGNGRIARLRNRFRKGAFSLGVGGVLVAIHDLGIGAALLAVAAIAIALDERLVRSSLLPWGGR